MLRAVVAATREAFANVEFLEAVESGGAVAALSARGAQLQTVRDAMDALSVEDFGGAVLGARGGEHGEHGGSGEVKYQHVSHGPGYSMGVFVLPPAGCIPLHSHPGMCVVSKLLYGDLRVRSYTFGEDHETSLSVLAAGGVARACMTERILSAPAATAAARTEADSPTATLLSLGPTEGNLHEFTTVGGCAIFDVLAPPYDDDHGRPCIYYRQHCPTTQEVSDLQSAGVAGGSVVSTVAAQPVEVLLEEWPWDTVDGSAGQTEPEMIQSVPLTVGSGPDLGYLLSKDRG
jgi:hypothetical protein